LWLDAVERLLSGLGFTVVGKLRSARAAVEAVSDSQPELVVTDIETADGPLTGIDVLAAAKDRTIPALVLSASEEPAAMEKAFAAGAAAYVLKSAKPSAFAAATRQALERSVYTAAAGPVGSGAPPAAAEGLLTRRELEVLALAAEGRSNSAIAGTLRITEQTVKLHLSNIYRKLGVGNRTQASRRAHALGLLEGSPSGEVELHVL
jgi:DNA-binding NarL/FixJ family response regulator